MSGLCAAVRRRGRRPSMSEPPTIPKTVLFTHRCLSQDEQDPLPRRRHVGRRYGMRRMYAVGVVVVEACVIFVVPSGVVGV
jgi:hypothetical protein